MPRRLPSLLRSRRMPALRTLVLVALALTVGPRAARAETAEPAGLPLTGAEASARLAGWYLALDKAEQDLPHDRFDPQAVVDEVGTDPRKLFDWVRDQTTWVAYRGVLRGPEGVLMDRMGNSLDRALLLADLLRRAGRDTRLAHARLAPALVARVFDELARQPAPGAPARSAGASPAVLAKRWGLAPDILERAVEKDEAQRTQIVQEVTARIARQVPQLAAMFAPNPEIDAREQVAQREALADHWWVQVREGDRWQDLDPELRDARFGTALSPAEQTMDQPDPVLHQTLSIRVVIEQWKDGRLTERPVLKATIDPATTYGERIVLTHQPLDWPKDERLLAAQDPLAEVWSLLADQHRWRPVLRAGAGTTAGESFTDGGDVGAGEGDDQAARQGGQVAGGLGGLGGALGGGGDDVPAHLTAEWIDFTFKVPGRPDRTVRREVFDLLGPAARHGDPGPEPSIGEDERRTAAGALVGQIELLVLTCDPAPAFVAELAVRRTKALQPVFERTLRERKAKVSDFVLSEQPSSVLYGLAMARRTWAGSTETYLDRLNVVALHSLLRVAPDGNPAVCEGIDIVENGVGVHGARGVFAARLKQGVVDTDAEAVLLGGCASQEDAAAQLAAAGPGWTLVRDARDSGWQAATVDPDIRARIDADLADGCVVMVGAAGGDSGPAAWWRIDPKTGLALGMGNHGWGQAMAEEAQEYIRISLDMLLTLHCLHEVAEDEHASETAKGVRMLGCIATGARGATMGLMGGEEESEILAWGIWLAWTGIDECFNTGLELGMD